MAVIASWVAAMGKEKTKVLELEVLKMSGERALVESVPQSLEVQQLKHLVSERTGVHMEDFILVHDGAVMSADDPEAQALSAVIGSRVSLYMQLTDPNIRIARQLGEELQGASSWDDRRSPEEERERERESLFVELARCGEPGAQEIQAFMASAISFGSDAKLACGAVISRVACDLASGAVHLEGNSDLANFASMLGALMPSGPLFTSPEHHIPASSRGDVVRGLSMLGLLALPYLGNALQDGNGGVRIRTLQAFAAFGESLPMEFVQMLDETLHSTISGNPEGLLPGPSFVGGGGDRNQDSWKSLLRMWAGVTILEIGKEGLPEHVVTERRPYFDTLVASGIMFGSVRKARSGYDHFELRNALLSYTEDCCVKLVRLGYLRQLYRDNGTLPRYDMVPDEVVCPIQQRSGVGPAVVVISHPWLVRGNPDPIGMQLREVVQRLGTDCEQMSCFRGIKDPLSDDQPIFIDYSGLPQNDFHSGVLRNAEEESLFRASLESLHILFAHEHSAVLLLDGPIPEGLILDGLAPNDEVRTELQPYGRRAWCQYERHLAQMKGNAPGYCFSSSMQSPVARVPPSPMEFHEELKLLSFSCARFEREEAMRTNVRDEYCRVFIARTQQTTRLDLGLSGGAEVVASYSKLLRYYCNLIEITLPVLKDADVEAATVSIAKALQGGSAPKLALIKVRRMLLCEESQMLLQSIPMKSQRQDLLVLEWEVPESPRSEMDELSAYLLACDQHTPPPPGYRSGYGLVNHMETDISIRCPAIRVAPPSSDDIVCYHYTHAAAFSGITGAWGPKHLKASFGERAHFGDGVYATRKSPGNFGSKEAILLNNYTNALDPEEQEAQIKEWREKGVADYCIPLVVPRSLAVDVMREKTKEMRQAGYTARHNQPIRFDRDIIVIVLPKPADKEIWQDMDSILQQCKSHDFSARLSAVEALAKEAASGDEVATCAVIKMLEDEDHNVRSAAVWATACATSLTLGEAMSQLAGLVNDPVKEVQCQVQDALKFLELAQ